MVRRCENKHVLTDKVKVFYLILSNQLSNSNYRYLWENCTMDKPTQSISYWLRTLIYLIHKTNNYLLINNWNRSTLDSAHVCHKKTGYGEILLRCVLFIKFVHIRRDQIPLGPIYESNTHSGCTGQDNGWSTMECHHLEILSSCMTIESKKLSKLCTQ